MTTDIIFIDHLRLSARVGVSLEERSLPQTIHVSVRLEISLEKACKTDDLRETLDYADAAKTVRGIVESSDCQLVESLAERIATKMLSLGGVFAAWIRIEKKTVTGAECVGIEISRRRDLTNTIEN